MKPNFKTYQIAGLKSKILKKRIYNYLSSLKEVKVLELYDYILLQIKDLNCISAFPPNINGPSIVAHDTAGINENRIYTAGLITIDVGIIYKNCIIDTAFFFVLNKPQLEYLVNINATLFKNLKTILKPGLEIKKISQYIEEYYKRENLFVIHELMGHTIQPPLIHAQPYIPATRSLNIKWSKLYEGQIFTIEPHIAIAPSELIYERAKIYSKKTNFYSLKDHPIINPISVEFYPVITLKNNVDAFSEEHTFYIHENEVIQLT
jgi:methionine aminopeptidase